MRRQRGEKEVLQIHLKASMAETLIRSKLIGAGDRKTGEVLHALLFHARQWGSLRNPSSFSEKLEWHWEWVHCLFPPSVTIWIGFDTQCMFQRVFMHVNWKEGSPPGPIHREVRDAYLRHISFIFFVIYRGIYGDVDNSGRSIEDREHVRTQRLVEWMMSARDR